MSGESDRAVLTVSGLSVGYATRDGEVNQVVRDVDLSLARGQILGLVGESGCGKSTAALASIGYRSPGVRILAGSSLLGDVDLLTLSTDDLRAVWGPRIAYVAQQATLALSPSLTVGKLMKEPLAVHMGLSGDALVERQLELLRMVDIPDPERALGRYPFQFSGGQQQRIAIAIAMSCEPQVLILDEPTTGLDVTTQARVSALLQTLVKETNVAALYVSHDLALLNSIADRIAVMYAGEVAELGMTDVVVSRPLHPYTKALMQAVPNVDRPGVIAGIPGRPPSAVVVDACSFASRCRYVIDVCRAAPVPLSSVGGHLVRCIRANEITLEGAVDAALPQVDYGEVLLEANELTCTFQSAPEPVLKSVGFTLRRGETLGIVGESGSGKSTLLRALSGLHVPVSGHTRFRGVDLEPRVVKRSRETRREIQLIFQNPDSSLNPRQTVRSIVARPIRMFRDDISSDEITGEVADLLEAVKLPRTLLHRYPAELSGGQKQRVAIARAFAAKPSVLLCDEVTSALDVSVQATILRLIAELAAETEAAVLFVSHDLAVVRTLASRAIVMRNGEVCEEGSTDQLFRAPQHPYTQSLIAAVPDLPVAV